jgi:hypothetical protein
VAPPRAQARGLTLAVPCCRCVVAAATLLLTSPVRMCLANCQRVVKARGLRQDTLRQEGTSASRKAVTKGAKDSGTPPVPSRGAVTLDLVLSAPQPMPETVPSVSWSPAGRARPKQYDDGVDGWRAERW